jgi:hypothetical protein
MVINRKLEADKDKLQGLIIKSIKTTMVGAVASIEEKLGDLWGQNKKGTPTESEQRLYETFMELRKEILDKGNTQIRNIKQLIDGYTVEFSGFQMTLPVVRKEIVFPQQSDNVNNYFGDGLVGR